MTRRQIAESLELDPIKVSHALKSLVKWREVDFIEHPWEEAAELVDYELSRRTRFFFIVED